MRDSSLSSTWYMNFPNTPTDPQTRTDPHAFSASPVHATGAQGLEEDVDGQAQSRRRQVGLAASWQPFARGLVARG